MTSETPKPQVDPNDTDLIEEDFKELANSLNECNNKIRTILKKYQYGDLSVLELNQVLQYLGKTNKVLSKTLDFLAEFKFILVQLLRIETRKQLGE